MKRLILAAIVVLVVAFLANINNFPQTENPSSQKTLPTTIPDGRPTTNFWSYHPRTCVTFVGMDRDRVHVRQSPRRNFFIDYVTDIDWKPVEGEIGVAERNGYSVHLTRPEPGECDADNVPLPQDEFCGVIVAWEWATDHYAVTVRGENGEVTANEWRSPGREPVVGARANIETGLFGTEARPDCSF